LLWSVPAAVFAQPGIGQNGVVNAASQIPPTLAGGAIARSSLFNIFGVRLYSDGRTTVTLSRPGVSIPLKVTDHQPRKLEVLMPASAPIGSSSLVVTVDGRSSKPFYVEVAAMNPGIFSRNLEGWGPGRIDNIDSSGNVSKNSPANPAHSGQHVSLVATGMGGAKTAWVVIGNRTATATVSISTAHEGEDLISFQIPPDVPSGCWVPVYLLAAPNRSSNVVTIAIRKGSRQCDPGLVPLWSRQRMVFAILSRTRMKSRREDLSDPLYDEANIAVRASDEQVVLSRNVLLPPPGTCTASTSSYQAQTDLSFSLSSLVSPGGHGLDAGPELTLRRSGKTRKIGQVWRNSGQYSARFGMDEAGAGRNLPGLFLEPGSYQLETSGGKDVGPFSIGFSIPAPFEWTDRDQTTEVVRSRGVTLHWKNAASDLLMLIVARNVDPITTAIGMCLCTARADVGQFTIPSALLASIPASLDAAGDRYNQLVIASLAAKTSAEVPTKGLDGGIAFTVYDSGRFISYR
jgi:uncharacterized protein (TIGR03437 family)